MTKTNCVNQTKCSGVTRGTVEKCIMWIENNQTACALNYGSSAREE